MPNRTAKPDDSFFPETPELTWHGASPEHLPRGPPVVPRTSLMCRGDSAGGFGSGRREGDLGESPLLLRPGIGGRDKEKCGWESLSP